MNNPLSSLIFKNIKNAFGKSEGRTYTKVTAQMFLRRKALIQSIPLTFHLCLMQLHSVEVYNPSHQGHSH